MYLKNKNNKKNTQNTKSYTIMIILASGVDDW